MYYIIFIPCIFLSDIFFQDFYSLTDLRDSCGKINNNTKLCMINQMYFHITYSSAVPVIRPLGAPIL